MTEADIICGANKWTGFYMISASVMKGLSQSRCSLEPKNFLWGLCPSKLPLRDSYLFQHQTVMSLSTHKALRFD